MDDAPSADQEPPSVRRRRGFRPDPPVRTRSDGGKGQGHRSAGRRDRPRQDDYVRQVCAVLRYDAFRLEECSALGQLPAVQALARRLQRSVFPTGTAIRTLMDRAVCEVEMVAMNQRDTTSRRIAYFLELWYREGEPVTLVADAMELSRSHVAHSIQKRALELVARRFLELAGRVEVPA